MNKSNYDVVIVGAGLCGALAASELSERGLKVLVLEAGSEFKSAKFYTKLYYAAATKTPDAPWPSTPQAERPKVLDMAFVKDWRDNPAHHVVQKGELPFSSTYERLSGGSANHWLGTTLRFIPSDFKLESSGVVDAVDWPISYDDIEGWYCSAEWELGVAGDHQFWNGYLGADRSSEFPMPAIAQSYLDRWLADGVDKFEFDGIQPVVSSTPQARNSRPYQQRPPCMGNTSCVPICPIQAKYDPSVHVRRAQSCATPAEFQYNSVVYRLVVDDNTDLIKELHFKRYSDQETLEKRVSAKVFVVCAHGIETPRILLNSPWKLNDEGRPITVANRSGQVGCNLMDHIICLGWGLAPEPIYPYRGPLSTSGIGEFRDGNSRKQFPAFRVEIGNDGWSWPTVAPYTLVHEQVVERGLRGAALVEAVKEHMTRQIRVATEIEMLPRETNRVELSTKHFDALGIPKCEIYFDLSEYEKSGFARSQDFIDSLFEHTNIQNHTSIESSSSAKFTHGTKTYQYRGAGHIIGTYRMGTDASLSVVDDFCQSHDHRNLYLLGSGVFPTSGTANPTLTIAALALRACAKIGRDLNVSDKEAVARQMAEVINRWREIASNEPRHLTSKVGDHSIVWWLDETNASTEDFMKALAEDSNLVVPGKLSESRLNTVYLRNDRRMATKLGDDAKKIKEWIKVGAPLLQSSGDTPKPTNGSTTSVPAFRSPEWYEELPVWFHKLVNIEDNAEFLPQAKKIAQTFFANANYDRLGVAGQYDKSAFHERMMEIYNSGVQFMNRPHPMDRKIYEDRATGKKYPIGPWPDVAVKERMKQIAPFNLTDGAWLQRIQSATPSSSVVSRLFEIWIDEAGNGNESQNHANVFDDLLKSVQIYLPPVTSQEFLDCGILPSMFSSPAMQFCVGLFPQEFFPELLGMTLLLEWNATPDLISTVRMYDRRGFNSHFYKLHVAIDNISSGHGALAKEAIEIYLDEQLELGGQSAVQNAWERIWNGYVAWATAGFDSIGMRERMFVVSKIRINEGTREKPKCYPDLQKFYRDEAVNLIKSKAGPASQVHVGKSIGGRALNSLFETPEKLLELLVSEGYFDSGRPSRSKFFDLLEFNGPMYKIFTEDEKQVLIDWLETMDGDSPPCIDPIDDDAGDQSLAKQVSELIVKYASEASAHEGITLPGPNGPTPMPELFDSPTDLMHALVNGGWVVPGNPLKSIFVTRILDNGGPMDNVFTAAEVDLIKKWIQDGATVEGSPKIFAAGLMSVPDAASFMANVELFEGKSMGDEGGSEDFEKALNLIH